MCKKWPKSRICAMSQMLFYSKNSYLVPRAHSTSIVTMALTKGQSHRSKVTRSNFSKMVKNLTTCYIMDAIFPIVFKLSTRAQPNKAHLMTQVTMSVTIGQGHRSRSNFSKNGQKNEQLHGHMSDAITPTYFILGFPL